MDPVMDPKMSNLQEVTGFFCKKSVIFKSGCFNNDHVINNTTHTKLCRKLF